MKKLKHLDVERIDELALMLDDEFSTFINTFLMHSEDLITSLKQQIANSDLAEFTISIHSLKGSCRNIGAEQLADYCLQIELLARKDERVTIEGKFLTFDQEFERLRSTLLKLARI